MMEEANPIESISLMQKIQENLLNYLENETNTEENFQILKSIFEDSKIYDDKHEFQLLLHLIVKIANNHYRGPDFHSKIEKILQIFKDCLKKNYSNTEIFNIFKSNKRILLFLIEEQIIIFDEYIVKKIVKNNKYIDANYPQFFQPEIKPFVNEKWFPTKSHDFFRSSDWIKQIKNEIPENFYELRKKGENEDPVCALIQKNMTKDFITYINKNNVPLDTTIKKSIYETNPFLLKKNFGYKQRLIEYAVFFGSIEIFNYLRLNEVKLDQSLWEFAIHSQNPEIIHILEDNQIEPKNKSYKNLLIESIKCHHNDIANYIMNFCMQKEEDYSQILFNQSLKYYNFAFIKDEFINESSFYNLCKFDYCKLVDILLENKEIDINKKVPESTENTNSHYNWEKERGKQVKSSFQIAVEKENIEIIRILLNNEKLDLNATYFEYSNKVGGCCNEFYKSEKNPFYTSVKNENIEIIQLLLNNEKIDVNNPNIRYGYCENEGREDFREEMKEETALSTATSEENIEIIQLLLNNEKLDVNMPFKYEHCRGSNDYGETGWNVVEITPFCIAVDQQNVEIINLLINNENIDLNTPCKNGKENRKDGKVTENNVGHRTAFIMAVMKENIEIVKILLDNEKVDINIPFIFGDKTEQSAFCAAIEKGNIEIIKLLLNNDKLSINGPNKFVGHYYYKEKSGGDWMAEMMGYRTSSMEDVIEEKTEFYMAVEKENIEVIKLLLENDKIDLNIPYKCYFYKDDDWIVKLEKTVFFEAVYKENIDIIRLLVNNEKIDINIISKCEGKINGSIIAEAEKTAFYLAVEKEKAEIIKLLLNNEKLDINLPYKCSVSEIDDMKSQEVKTKVIQNIFNVSSFDVNLLNKEGSNQTRDKTPLHLAVEKGDVNIIELLLSNKSIDVSSKDEQGKTPSDYTPNDIIKQMLNK